MFEESIWASVNSWFTPTVFFLLLNVTIATIYVTSTLAAAPKHHRDLLRSPSVLQRLKSVNFYTHRSHEPSAADFHSHSAADFENPHENRLFARSPSILQRLKSINLYNYLSHEPTVDDQTQSHVDTDALYGSGEVEPPSAAAAEEEDELRPSMEEVYSKLQESGRMSRSQSDTKPAAGEMPAKLARKMRKSASSKSAFGHFEAEEVVEARRPATVREGKEAAAEEEEVDARADDFINKFKQQLKLQRIDSIVRYKEMVGRASGSTHK